MLLAAEVLLIVLLLVALYLARRHAVGNRMPDAGKRSPGTTQLRMSARTEMRAFSDLTAVTRTLTDSGAMRRRPPAAARRTRRKSTTAKRVPGAGSR